MDVEGNKVEFDEYLHKFILCLFMYFSLLYILVSLLPYLFLSSGLNSFEVFHRNQPFF